MNVVSSSVLNEQGKFFTSIERGGILLRPELEQPQEAMGVLNPAVAGDYLIYRAVEKNNYSRLMAASLHIHMNHDGFSIHAQKLNRVILEPTEEYELSPDGKGGVEDPRITPLPDGGFAMFYTAYGLSVNQNHMPVVALATSPDGLTWKRHGRITFAPYHHGTTTIDFNTIPNKDTVLFSEKINGKYALYFRPMLTPEQAKAWSLPWRSIWYAESDQLEGPWGNQKLVLDPQFDWEHDGIGPGIPPIHFTSLWLNVYHGFTQKNPLGGRKYNAGIFTTPHNDPTLVTYHSPIAVLEPEVREEIFGTVSHVVFPTGAWPLPQENNKLAVFWGAADMCIMWGILHLPFSKGVPSVWPRHTAG